MSKVPPISLWAWREKYRWSDEETIEDTMRRVVAAVYKNDKPSHADQALNLMEARVLMPAGRILAGAGTDRQVTLINCFVSPDIPDSMEGIMDSLKVAAVTQQRGGGIGMDFSTIRPKGAPTGAGSPASGPLSFMEMWNSMCATVMSAGSRRGAMMATLRVDHPDIEAFIEAKHTKGKLTNFNMSVLVTDAFMDAVRIGAPWPLVFGDRVYKTLSARDLWAKIIASTHEYSEPGVIFIDRVNAFNNLHYCETIHCTNPCGEQPLPPNGDCNLIHINLAACVRDPFTPAARVDGSLVSQAAATAIRFNDNVLDITLFPTEAQAAEAKAKRRIGLGITGLANAFAMRQVRYGSPESLAVLERIMTIIRDEAYTTSIELAKERGAFPLFDKEQYLAGAFIKTLPLSIRSELVDGIRNSHLLSIAPTGTTSLLYNNVSSSLEPTFFFNANRKVLNADGTFDEFEVEDFGWAEFKRITGSTGTGPLPNYMVTAKDISLSEHLTVQATIQRFVDASVSKTINVPESTTLAQMSEVYTEAYRLGCKSCTTYRPTPLRGSVISEKVEKPPADATLVVTVSISDAAPPDRPYVLAGSTYKIKWPSIDEAYYVTINDLQDEGIRRPFEIFINSKSVVNQEWIGAFTRVFSAVLRRGSDGLFLLSELSEVHSAAGGHWIDKKYHPSIVAYIASVIREHFKWIEGLNETRGEAPEVPPTPTPQPAPSLAPCPKCGSPTLIHKEGCDECLHCGYSSCGG